MKIKETTKSVFPHAETIKSNSRGLLVLKKKNLDWDVNTCDDEYWEYFAKR